MEKLLWVIAGALGLLGLLFLIFSPIGKVISLCMLVLGCVLAAFLALHRWAQKKPKAAPECPAGADLYSDFGLGRRNLGGAVHSPGPLAEMPMPTASTFWCWGPGSTARSHPPR